MVIVIFRSHMRSNAPLQEVEAAGARMYELASGMPGFLSYKDFRADDGENLTLVEFESESTLLAWRNHPEHRKVQERGREVMFADYRITVCEPQRAYRFSPTDGRVELE